MTEQPLYERPTGIDGGPAEFFITFIDSITGGVWGTALILMSFGLVYLSLNTFNPRKAFAAGSFTAFVVTVLLVPLGAAGDFHFAATLLAVVLAIIINTGGNR